MASQRLLLDLLKQGAIATSLAVSTTLALTSNAIAATFRVTVENLAPENGTFITPLWFGVHDGGFDLFNIGEPASEALERIAEDGTLETINQTFAENDSSVTQGAVFGVDNPPIAPGTTTSATFSLDADPTGSLYLSYAAMVLPSNDAFIGNEDPFAVEIFDESGDFVGADFVVPGASVYDAGTEVNDEAETTTAFFGQTTPDTGEEENGTVQLHPGFIPGGRILSSDQFSNADFTEPGYEVVRISVEQVPEPSAVLGLLATLGIFATVRAAQRSV